MSEDEMTRAHPDIETLADLAADLDVAADIRSHVAACTECTADADGLRRTLAALSTVPEASMPGDVARRIDAAIATAERHSASATVLPMPGRARPRWMPLSAAAAAVLMVGVAGLALRSTLRDGGGSDAGTAAQGISAAGPGPIFDTDTNYTAANLPAAVPGLVTGRARRTAAAPLARADAKSPPTGEAGAGVPQVAAAVIDPLERLRAAPALRSCLDALTETPGQSAVAIDYARFAGQPALVVVLPARDKAKLDVFVVGPKCTSTDADVKFFRRVDR